MSLINEHGRILENICVGPQLYLMYINSPALARNILPGQFVHLKIPSLEAHLLRRPFSVYQCNKQAGVLKVLYQVVGDGTAFMSKLTDGQNLELIGPLGRTWLVPAEAKKALLVGGGVGAAPLFMLCEQLVSAKVHTDVILGAQTAEALACMDSYKKLLALAPRCSTDDGTFGTKGFCTSLVQKALDQAKQEGSAYNYVAVCGPEPLMKYVAGTAQHHHIPCEVSLERRMACGVGACLSCVVDTTEGKQRACVDGPIFDAQKVVW